MALAWDDYRFLLAVAEAKTLAGAARMLKVAQPTVGRRLEQLETEAGCLFFERRASGLVLTEVGRQVAEIAEEMRVSALRIESAAADARTGRRRPVRIATTRGLANGWLVPALARLRALRPEIAIELQIGLAPAHLGGHEADIALRMGRGGRDEEMGRRVGSVHCGLYASTGYLEATGAPRSLADLARHTIIGSTGEVASFLQVRRLAEHAAAAAPWFAADDVSVQITAMRAGFGLLAAPCCMVEPLEPSIVRVLPNAFDVAVDLRLLINRRLRGVEPYCAVYDFLVKACLADRAVFEGRGEARGRLHISAEASPETGVSAAGDTR